MRWSTKCLGSSSSHSSSHIRSNQLHFPTDSCVCLCVCVWYHVKNVHTTMRHRTAAVVTPQYVYFRIFYDIFCTFESYSCVYANVYDAHIGGTLIVKIICVWFLPTEDKHTHIDDVFIPFRKYLRINSDRDSACLEWKSNGSRRGNGFSLYWSTNTNKNWRLCEWFPMRDENLSTNCLQGDCKGVTESLLVQKGSEID